MQEFSLSGLFSWEHGMWYRNNAILKAFGCFVVIVGWLGFCMCVCVCGGGGGGGGGGAQVFAKMCNSWCNNESLHCFLLFCLVKTFFYYVHRNLKLQCDQTRHSSLLCSSTMRLVCDSPLRKLVSWSCHHFWDVCLLANCFPPCYMIWGPS